MAETWFTPKEWKARLVEFAGRRHLRNVANGESTTYDVSRSEGQVSQEGDAFNTKNMNDLEQRIANGFANAKTVVETLSSDLGGLSFGQDADGNWGYKAGGADTVIPFKNGKAIQVTVEGKGDIAGAWTVDLGIKVNAFAWFCPNITGLSNDCAGICWGNIKKFMTANIQGNSKNMNYVIDGTKVTFPADSAHTFRNGAIVYFIVI